jgi:hypothetical protein
MDYYERDNAFYKRWEEISKTREGFLKWLSENVFFEQTASLSQGTGSSESLK